MSLQKKIGIEPLGDGRWTRIERALFNSLPATAGDLPLESARERFPVVRWKAATALVFTGAAAAAFGAMAIRSLGPTDGIGPTRIATAANGSRVEVGESTVDVGPQSSVRLVGDDVHGISVLLDNGRVECDVSPRHGRPPFLVEAGAVEVRVIGTHFVVTRAGDAVGVVVARGKVEVLSGQDHAFVVAGGHWPALAPKDEAVPLPPQAVATPAPEPARSSADDSNAHHPAPEAHTAAAPAVRSPRDEYESASKLEAQKPDTALALYADLARQGGAWGRNALFAEGRLEADRGRRDDAQRLLEEYLRRYPFGPNAEDAQRLLQRMR